MFSERLKKLRNKKEMSQEDLAKLINVKQQTIGGWETGRTQPDQDTLIRLADFFNVTIDYLLGRTDQPDPAQTIADAIADDKELSDFWEELRQREDLQLLFKQTKTLSPATIKRVIKYIKMVEDEEAAED